MSPPFFFLQHVAAQRKKREEQQQKALGRKLVMERLRGYTIPALLPFSLRSEDRDNSMRTRDENSKKTKTEDDIVSISEPRRNSQANENEDNDRDHASPTKSNSCCMFVRRRGNKFDAFLGDMISSLFEV